MEKLKSWIKLSEYNQNASKAYEISESLSKVNVGLMDSRME